MKEKHGEYILLHWDCAPENYYIKGHVDLTSAAHTIGDEENKGVVSISHKYARWTFADEFTPEGCDFKFTLYDKPQRGAFKVTECNL